VFGHAAGVRQPVNTWFNLYSLRTSSVARNQLHSFLRRLLRAERLDFEQISIADPIK